MTSGNSWRPLSVKLKVTFGWLNWSKFGFGSVMSVPESAGRSLITNQAGVELVLGPCLAVRRPGRLLWTTSVPWGTVSTICVLGGCFCPGRSMKRSFFAVCRARDAGRAVCG